LVRILRDSGRLTEIFANPQRFLDQVAAILKFELHRLLVDGIKYEKIVGKEADAEWEQLLFKNEELVNFLTAQPVTKAPYEYVVYDSEVERAFAQGLNSVQIPAKAVSGLSAFSANHTTSFFLVSGLGSSAYSAKLLNGTRHRLSGFSQPRQCGEEVFRMLVTGAPPNFGGGAWRPFRFRP